jgi:hypothetical protein
MSSPLLGRPREFSMFNLESIRLKILMTIGDGNVIAAIDPTSRTFVCVSIHSNNMLVESYFILLLVSDRGRYFGNGTA